MHPITPTRVACHDCGKEIQYYNREAWYGDSPDPSDPSKGTWQYCLKCWVPKGHAERNAKSRCTSKETNT